MALATVAVVVDVDLQAHRLVQAEITGNAGHIVIAQAVTGVIGVPRAVDATTVLSACSSHRAIPVRRVVVPVPAEAIDHLQRQVLVVGLDAARSVGQRGDPAVRAEVVGGLAVELLQFLRALALPLVAFGIHAGQVSGKALVVAGIEACIAAARIVAAEALCQHDPIFGGRIDRVELEHAAEVAGGRRTQRTNAGGDLRTAQVLADHRAADVQAVAVAVGHVAQRDAIEGVAQAILVEATQADAGGPFVGAGGIGRFEMHARLGRQQLQRVGTGRQDLHVLGGHALHLAGFAAADHRDRIEGRGRLRVGRGGGFSDSQRRQRSTDQQGQQIAAKRSVGRHGGGFLGHAGRRRAASKSSSGGIVEASRYMSFTRHVRKIGVLNGLQAVGWLPASGRHYGYSNEPTESWARLSKRVYSPKNFSLHDPVGPPRCLPMMISARPLSGEFSLL